MSLTSILVTFVYTQQMNDEDEYKQSSIAADQTFSKSKIKYSLFFHIIYSYYNKIQGNSIIHE